MTGSLVQSLVVKDSKATIELFFPWLYKKIMGIKRDNPEVIQDEYNMDSELYWYILLLCDVVMAASSDILPYYDQLIELVNIATEIKVVSGMRLVTKLHTYLISTLVGVHIYRRNHR
jgi:cytochrome b subunit of formate dehydrogenase